MHDVIKDISDFIFVSDAPAHADIIFIPGGSYPELPEHAAKLFKEGYAPLVLPTGKYSVKHGRFQGVRSKADVYNGDYRTECAFITDALLKNGVPASAILREDRSEYTQQNAFFSREVTDGLGLHIEKAIIVCRSFHARRCLTYWQLAFPETVFFVCPVSTNCIAKENWFQTENGVDRVLGELARCGNQMTADIKRSLFPGSVEPNGQGCGSF
ncbi:MAG: YdcF family protein [Clostridia bacterium]|nr:YdcF family protein [Clostridia bacterium]